MHALRKQFSNAIALLATQYPATAARTIFVEKHTRTAFDAAAAPDPDRIDEILMKLQQSHDSNYVERIGDNLSLLVYAPLSSCDLFSGNTPQAMYHLRQVVYHEFGHIVMPDAMGGLDASTHDTFRAHRERNNETRADAFSMVQYMAEHGNNPGFAATDLGLERALQVLDYGSSHAHHDYTGYLTTMTVDAIGRDAQRINMNLLSPAQRIEAADYYAKTYGLGFEDNAAVEKLLDDFKPVIRLWPLLYHNPSDTRPLSALAQVARTADITSPSYYLAARILTAFLSDDTPQPLRTRGYDQAKPQGKYHRNIGNLLREKSKHLAASDWLSPAKAKRTARNLHVFKRRF